MMQPTHCGDGWSVHVGDSLRILTEWEGPAFAGVVTDPPYSSGGQTRADRTMRTRTKYLNSDSPNQHTLEDFDGDNRDQRSWLVWMSIWLDAARRVTEPGGSLLMFCDWRQLPTATDAVQAGGWVWRGIIPWNKTEEARPQKGRFRAQCEYVVWATHGPHVPYADDAPCLPGWFTCIAPRDRIHVTEKPVAVEAELCRVVRPDGLICDPFLGSGAHGEGAITAGRQFVGFERMPTIADLAARRLAEAALQQPLFGGRS